MDFEVFYALIKTLNSISVRGREDCDKMAGCIKALESLVYMAKKDLEKKNAEQGKESKQDKTPSVEEEADG